MNVLMVTHEKKSDSIVTVSDALGNKVRSFVKQNKLVTIHNGVGEENIINRNFSEKTENTFLVVGTIQQGKGQDVAINAVCNSYL
jgi:glycosyltransferase involved in cell wall biosynthesis